MTEQNQTHIVYDRTQERQRTLGYRVVDASDSHVGVIAAETRCHPNDRFEKRIARGHVDSRLDSFADGHRSPRLRAFAADVTMTRPTTASEWRELEETLLWLADIRLPTPAAVR